MVQPQKKACIEEETRATLQWIDPDESYYTPPGGDFVGGGRAVTNGDLTAGKRKEAGPALGSEGLATAGSANTGRGLIVVFDKEEEEEVYEE